MNCVGMPAALHLDVFGALVEDYFDEIPYLVGSATKGKDWRDVDVRVMLDEDRFVRLFGFIPSNKVPSSTMPQWASLCAAFSALGRQMTGLPVDFQVQLADDANARYPKSREPLGMRITEGGPRWR